MTRTKRHDGRRANQLRDVKITPDFVSSAAGSCLIEVGGTRVICTASVEQSVPRWREASGKGWVTAEYGMLPASTGRRKSRPGLKPDSRGVEIQRLIGRVLRSVICFEKFPGVTIHLDCDVLEADGGTRTASITGAMVALEIAVRRGLIEGTIQRGALASQVAAVSVGVVKGAVVADLDYIEDSRAEVDMNVAMNKKGQFVEVQGTSEGAPFDRDQLDAMLDVAGTGIRKLLRLQTQAVKQAMGGS
ncbi:MAG: ribonuclease PH [Phycisphaerales bacterium]|jgi:ribonuclease PH|nr:ribonuclease PH [Phycisphaerales bacterium]MBT7171573.1 ribonuclease PH [Phycisphaerales bacterium]